MRLHPSSRTAIRLVAFLIGLAIPALLILPAVMGRSRVLAMESQSLPDDAFQGGTAWIGTEAPLRAPALRGQVVLIDFWTYCCINCIHVMDDLSWMEREFKGQPFLVLGVHSGKFSAEKDPERIRAAIRRHRIHHPVVVDSDYTIWNRFGVDSWPSLVLVGPDGVIIGAWSGEGHRDEIAAAVRTALADGAKAKTLAAAPLTFAAEPEPAGVLAFPGKVLADAAGGRLFISDSGHDRVLIAGLSDGVVQQVIGAGTPGFADGPATTATLREPQGLALSADGLTLWIADRQNHAIRAVDLTTMQVRTIAGNGTQGRDRRTAGPAASIQLNSPWDLATADGGLYIAMAGHHQIWRLDLATGVLGPFAGTGIERDVDAEHRKACFAQPSGLAVLGGQLFVADSEVSSIRRVEIDPSVGGVSTVAGSGDLFGFGATDATGILARFQHPLGIAVAPDGKMLVVADTFNNRLRLVDPATRAVTSIGPGPAVRHLGDKPPVGEPPAWSLDEPGGLSVAGGVIYVADTNHHRIVTVTGDTATVLPITLPATPPAAPPTTATPAPAAR